jgi:hypothetical protein
MQIPMELKPALWGAFAGAVALAIIGFNWGGWVLGATAEQKAKRAATEAVVAALAPICADKFRQNASAGANLAEMQKINVWQQGAYLEKGGFATLPGASLPDSAVARACAELLNTPKT